MKTIWTYLSVIAVMLLMASAAQAEKNPFKLKAGARGKQCLGCHAAFEEKLEKKFIHTPVKEGQCSGCHNPHASSHGALLAENAQEVCVSCHSDIVPEGEGLVSSHKVVMDGDCVKCHDPHSAQNRNNLLLAENDLCVSCHSDIGRNLKAAKVIHAPVNDGCVSCHLPHGSMKGEALLTNGVPSICLDCHDGSTKVFRKLHMDYPVQDSQCTSCHNPHGGSKKGIFHVNLHSPVEKKMCNQCHESASSANPLATKKQGYELCRLCHSTMINETMAKQSIHGPVLDSVGCQNCHAPHASMQSGLLKSNPLKTCGSCHGDTIARQMNSMVKHEPISGGECSSCHTPHSSDQAFYLKIADQRELCGQCHDWQVHSTHPLGNEVVDSRNPNLRLECTSCHRTHGTEYDNMLLQQTTTEQCVQCHKSLRR